MNMFGNQNTQNPPATQPQTQQTNPNDYDVAPAEEQTVYDLIGAAQPNEGGVYPLPGLYPVLYVDVLKMIITRKKEKMFVAEFEICNSEVAERPVGTKMNWVGNFKHDAVPGNVRMLLAAIMGVQLGEVDSAGSKLAVSERNPCHGRLVRLTATQTTTKAGNPFVLCTWDALPESEQAKANDYRNAAGFAPF